MHVAAQRLENHSTQYILAKWTPHVGEGGVPTKGKRGEVVPILLSGNITHIHKLPKLLMTKSSKEDSELIRTV